MYKIFKYRGKYVLADLDNDLLTVNLNALLTESSVKLRLLDTTTSKESYIQNLFQQMNGVGINLLDIVADVTKIRLNKPVELLDNVKFIDDTKGPVIRDSVQKPWKIKVDTDGILSTEECPFLLTADEFKYIAGSGTMSNPPQLNDGITIPDNGCVASEVGKYVEVTLPDWFRFKQFRQFGSPFNVGDGTWTIEYYDGDWHILYDDLPTKVEAEWSDWIEAPFELIGSKIKLTCKVLDSAFGGSRIRELEVKW